MFLWSPNFYPKQVSEFNDAFVNLWMAEQEPGEADHNRLRKKRLGDHEEADLVGYLFWNKWRFVRLQS